MNARTGWEEGAVVKDLGAVFDAAASLPSCRTLSMDGFFRTLDLDDLKPFYHLDPGQPLTWEQPYIAPSVTIVRIEHPKMPGVNILPLFSADDLRHFSHDILTEGDD